MARKSISKTSAYFKKMEFGGRAKKNKSKTGSEFVPNITDSRGDFIDLGNNLAYLVGPKHKNGGINIGRDLNAEGGTRKEEIKARLGLKLTPAEKEKFGEVVENDKRDGSTKVYSAQPIMPNDMSPAEFVVRGGNKDYAFNYQENYKRMLGINDDGTRAEFGTQRKPARKGYTPAQLKQLLSKEDKPIAATNRSAIPAPLQLLDNVLTVLNKPREVKGPDGKPVKYIIGEVPIGPAIGKAVKVARLAKNLNRVTRREGTLYKLANPNRELNPIVRIAKDNKSILSKADEAVYNTGHNVAEATRTFWRNLEGEKVRQKLVSAGKLVRDFTWGNVKRGGSYIKHKPITSTLASGTVAGLYSGTKYLYNKMQDDNTQSQNTQQTATTNIQPAKPVSSAAKSDSLELVPLPKDTIQNDTISKVITDTITKKKKTPAIKTYKTNKSNKEVFPTTPIRMKFGGCKKAKYGIQEGEFKKDNSFIPWKLIYDNTPLQLDNPNIRITKTPIQNTLQFNKNTTGRKRLLGDNSFITKGDIAEAGANTLFNAAELSSNLVFNKKQRREIDSRRFISAPLIKLNNTVGINPQLHALNQQMIAAQNAMLRNTSSSNVALNRFNALTNAANQNMIELYNDKYNKENENINKQILTNAGITQQNVGAYNSFLDRQSADRIKNYEERAKAISDALNAQSTIFGNFENRYENRMKSIIDFNTALTKADPATRQAILNNIHPKLRRTLGYQYIFK